MDRPTELFLRYRERGDVAALGAVFDALAPRLLGLALHLCGEPADAEDALQQTFVHAMRDAAAFDAARPLEPWLAGLLANVARNLQRREARRRAAPLPEVATSDGGPLAAAQRAELVAQLRTQVDALPREQRQALLLQLRHGLTPAEIAEVLDVPPGTVRMRLHRGLRALRRLLPAGLAALLGGALPARGLAAVRTAVLREARRALPVAGAGAAAAGLGGALAMKKVIAVCFVALAAGALWLAQQHPPAATRGEVAQAPPAAPHPLGVQASRVHEAPEEGPAAARTDVATNAHAALTVCVRASGAGEDARSLPLAGRTIRIWPGEVPFEPYEAGGLALPTGTAGEARFEGLAPGPWQVLDACDRDAEAQRIELVPGEEARVEIVRAAAGIVRGRVVDENGLAVADAEVWVSRGSLLVMGRYTTSEPVEQRVRLAARSDGEGRFEIAHAADESTLAARKPGYAPSFARSVSRGGGPEPTLVLGPAPASVAGIVLGPDGEPVAGALVGLTPSDEQTRRAADGTMLMARLPQLARTSPEGRFLFAAVSPGAHKVWARAAARWSAWHDVAPEPFARADVVLRCDEGLAIAGRVLCADGSPARVGVYARPSPDRNGHYNEASTRPDGSYLLQLLPRRTLFLTVEYRRRTLLVRELESPPAGVLRCDLVLPPLAALLGRAVGPDGAPLAGWTVFAIGEDAADPRAYSDARTDAEGAFAVPHLEGEAFLVRLLPPDGPPHVALERRGVRADVALELRVPEQQMPRARVSGRLVDGAGRPRADIAIEARRAAWGSGLAATGRSARDGTFVLGPLSPGALELVASGDGGPERALADLELAAGEQRDLGTLVLPALATLRLEVTHADGAPWQAALPFFEIRDAGGARVDVAAEVDAGARQLRLAPGTYHVAVRGPDLRADPQDVVLADTETRTLRFAVALGHTRRLVFNGDGFARPKPGTPLHVEVRAADGAVVLARDVTDLYPDLRGFRYWHLEHPFAPGRYQVEAHAEGDLRYRATFDVRAALDDPTRIDVPRV